MAALKIAHVAVAVCGIEETSTQMEKVFGVNITLPQNVESLGVRSVFLKLGDGEIECLSRNGIKALPSGISCNSDGKRVVFLNLGQTANLLIELVEDTL